MDRPEGHATAEISQSADRMSRRRLLLAGTGTVLAASGLAACGGHGSATRSEGSSAGSGKRSPGPGSSRGGEGAALAHLSEIRVKAEGGKVVEA